MNKKKRSNNDSGVTIIEYTISILIVIIAIFAIIDISRFLYLDDILDAQAHQALSVASWAPGLELEEGSNEFKDALDRITEHARGSQIEALFTGGNAYIKKDANSGKVHTKVVSMLDVHDHDQKFKQSQEGIVVGLPPTDSPTVKTRLQTFQVQPIGIKINAVLHPLTPFFPTLNASGEAWGYREVKPVNTLASPRDCKGNPVDPNNPLTAADCNCPPGVIIDPFTGQCGCQPPRVEAVDPITNRKTCYYCPPGVSECSNIPRCDNGASKQTILVDGNYCACPITDELKDVKDKGCTILECDGVPCGISCSNQACQAAFGLGWIWNKTTCRCECTGDVEPGTNRCICRGKQDYVNGYCSCKGISCPGDLRPSGDDCECKCPGELKDDDHDLICGCVSGTTPASNNKYKCCPPCLKNGIPDPERIATTDENGNCKCSCDSSQRLVEIGLKCEVDMRCGQEGGPACSDE